jgi:transposase
MSKARLVITAVEVEGRTLAEVIAAYGVSRSWLYELLKRYRAEGAAAFEPRSRRPHISPRATPAATVELVLQLRKQLTEAGLDAGADTVAWHLTHHHQITLSRATVHRILTRAGTVTPQPAKRPKASYLRFQAEQPNDLAIGLHPLPAHHRHRRRDHHPARRPLPAGAAQLGTPPDHRAPRADLWSDSVWLVDSTPVECARSRPTALRSDLAGVAGYGYRPSHTRWFWGLRLHLICTPAGLPITWALAPPRHDDRHVLMCVLDADADLLTDRPGRLLLADKNYIFGELDDYLHRRGAALLRPSYSNRPPRLGQHLLAPIRQLIESVYDTLKGQLDLELHGGRSLTGVDRPCRAATAGPSPPPSGTTGPPASPSPGR